MTDLARVSPHELNRAASDMARCFCRGKEVVGEHILYFFHFTRIAMFSVVKGVFRENHAISYVFLKNAIDLQHFEGIR